tara:strand:- start:1052 stop:2167 length:1116 start_codon:yes stop_codon:yes gene_type:complete
LNKKLKIAIIGSRGYPYVYSGYETLVKEISERIVKKGHNVRVYCHRPLFKKKPKIINGIELVYTPSIETKFLSQFVNSFFSFLHVCFSDIDVVLVVNSANGPFGLLTKIFRKKTCINVDGLEWLRPKWRGLGSLYFKISSKLSTILFDKVITDSVEMNIIYLKRFNKTSKVIAYGSTMQKYNDKSFLKKFNITEKEYYLVVGRLIPDNNSKLIIEGFLKSKSNKKIVIVGDVPYPDNYADSVKKLSSSKVIFTGYISNQIELSLLYQNAYGYVHGHEYGGTNPTMINALQHNCQIMALNTVFNIEMLLNKKSILFEKNIKSISETFKNFELFYNKICEDNINYKISKKYSWEYITNEYVNVFLSLKNFQNK